MFTLACIVNKIHCGIYTYTACKSQTIYTHNTALDISYFNSIKNVCESCLSF